MILAIKTKDMVTLLKHHPSNMLLAIPLATALLPAFIEFPLPIPTELIIPHLILIGLLGFSILTDIKHLTTSIAHTTA